MSERRRPGGGRRQLPALRTSVEVSHSAIQHTRAVLVQLADEIGLDALELTNEWVVEKSLQLAATALKQTVRLEAVRSELAKLADDTLGFRELD